MSQLATDPYEHHPGWAYVIAGPLGHTYGLVKIGWTKDVDVRLRELQRGSPVILQVHRKWPGGQCLESWLHRAFRDRRRHGEWFRLAMELGAIDAEVPRWVRAARREECRCPGIPRRRMYADIDSDIMLTFPP